MANLEGMSVKSEKIVILGIGNILMGDEGIGVHVVNRLNALELPENIEVVDGGTGSFNLLGLMQEADKVILVDATIDDDKPGTVKRLIPKFSKDYPQTLTAHDIGLKDLLDAFYLMNDIPNVVLYAVSIAPLPEGLSLELSPEIGATIPRIINLVKAEIKDGIKIQS